MRASASSARCRTSPAATTSRSGSLIRSARSTSSPIGRPTWCRRYNNGRPSSVTVYTTPYNRFSYVNYDLGIFAQDSWTIKRLTLNLGVAPRQLRLEDRSDVDAGRPVRRRAVLPGARARAAVAVGRVAALQHGLRPVRRRPHGAEGQLQPLSRSADRRLRRPVLAGRGQRDAQLVRLHDQRGGQRVRDRRARCRPTTTTSRRPTKSGLAVRRSASAKIAISIRTFSASGIPKSRPACSTSCSRVCRSSRSTIAARSRTWRCSIASSSQHGDYTSFQAPLPADISRDPEVAAIVSPGELVTIYNLQPAKLPVYTSQQRDKTIPDLTSTYNGFDFAMTARTPGGGTIFGSWTVEKNISNFCANDDNPNGVAHGGPVHGVERRGGRGLLRSGRVRYAVPARVQDGRQRAGSVGYRSRRGAAELCGRRACHHVGAWRPACSPAGRTRSETITLNEPGSLYYPRYNQVDFNIKKTFRAGRKTFSGQIDWFNMLNGNAVFSRNSAVGASLGQIQTILQGRLTRLAFQMKW